MTSLSKRFLAALQDDCAWCGQHGYGFWHDGLFFCGQFCARLWLFNPEYRAWRKVQS